MPQKIYEAEPAVLNMLQDVRQTVQTICREHEKQKVRIEALDGKVYEGQLVKCDGTHVYLEVEEEVEEQEQDQPEWYMPVAYTYRPCYPYSSYCYPYPPYSPYPYPFPTYTAPIADSPDSPAIVRPRRKRRRRRCRVIPLALYTLLNIVLI